MSDSTTVSKPRCLVTGAAGFIGFHLTNQLLKEAYPVFAVDSLNSYYSLDLKKSRLAELERNFEAYDIKKAYYKFEKMDLLDPNHLEVIVDEFKPDVICHLAAQAGVRYSLKYPQTYVDNNISATINVLEIARKKGVKDIIFASTSSVYGLGDKMPYVEDMPIDSTISVYSATKRSCELLLHAYHKLYGIRARILRFFTVYGPWGRPDMALFKFTKSILNGEKIKIFNNGEMCRDFTYVDDIVSGFVSSINNKYEFEIINLGNGNPVSLLDFIDVIESSLEIKARKEFMPMQPGDVPKTWADISKAKNLLNFIPKTNVNKGVQSFLHWYRLFYKI